MYCIVTYNCFEKFVLEFGMLGHSLIILVMLVEVIAVVTSLECSIFSDFTKLIVPFLKQLVIDSIVRNSAFLSKRILSMSLATHQQQGYWQPCALMPHIIFATLRSMHRKNSTWLSFNTCQIFRRFEWFSWTLNAKNITKISFTLFEAVCVLSISTMLIQTFKLPFPPSHPILTIGFAMLSRSTTIFMSWLMSFIYTTCVMTVSLIFLFLYKKVSVYKKKRVLGVTEIAKGWNLKNV